MSRLAIFLIVSIKAGRVKIFVPIFLPVLLYILSLVIELHSLATPFVHFWCKETKRKFKEKNVKAFFDAYDGVKVVREFIYSIMKYGKMDLVHVETREGNKKILVKVYFW